MIVSNKTTKDTGFFTTIFKVLKLIPKPTFNQIPVKFPLKYFLVTVLLTIIIWSVIASAMIYRNAYKPEISKLADILHFKGRREKHKTGKAIKAFLLAPFNWVSANLNQEIPHIYIDIKFENYLKLVKKREKALIRGTLRPSSKDYVPVKIRYKGNSLKAKLRLKGELPDHWEGDKWSFRVNMKDDDRLFGFSRFALHNPPTRRYESEIIYFSALKREGILAPRYFFVDLTVNGKYIGVMGCQEHFSKELLESQGRKESVIVKFDEDNIYSADRGQGLMTTAAFNSFRSNLIEPYRPNQIKKSKDLSKDLKNATGLLRGFANGTLSTSQVFDIELMGRFLAVAAAWGAEHPIRHRNMKFYYNPITGLLEPIGYDGTLDYFKRRYFDITANYDTIGSDIMESDPEIKPIYETALKKLKKEAESGITEGWVMSVQKQSLNILHKEYPLLGGINMFGMAEGIQGNLERSKDLYSKYNTTILFAHMIEDKSGSYIELVNPLPHHVVISNIELVTGDSSKRKKIKFLPELNYPFELSRTPLQNVPTSIKLYYSKFVKNQNDIILIHANIKGHKKTLKVQARPYFAPKNKGTFPVTTINKALKDHPYLIYSPDLNSFRIKKGTWIVEKTLVIPKGYSLTIPESTNLQFKPDSALILMGPLIIQGTLKNPVRLSSLKNSHPPNNIWPGIVIQKTTSVSKWANVTIHNTAGIDYDDWKLSGGVNFYEAPVQMKNVSIIGNQADDALNIVRSKFELDKIIITNTNSDAVDADFSEGIIENSIFENIGNSGSGDGIDVSGSTVSVKNTSFKNISDKALSVGEKSRMTASNIIMEKTRIAAVSKDGSFLSLTDAKIKSASKAGLMAYIKKSEYGTASIEATNIKMEAVDLFAIAQKGSHININGSHIEETDLDVKSLYATQINSGLNK